MNDHEKNWDPEEREALKGVREEIEDARERHRKDPSLEMLRAADAGTLPAEMEEPVREHLARSEWSRALVEGAKAADASLDEKAEDRIFARIQKAARQPEPSRWGVRFLWLTVATTGALAVLTLVMILRTPAPPSSLSASARPGVTTPSPAQGFRLGLEKPDVKLTADALVVRGQSAGNHLMDDLVPAVKAYRAGAYADAEMAFSRLVARYPNSTEALFYLGISRLFLNDARGAATALQSARKVSSDSFAADITWYLAVAHERMGDLTQAHAELDSLCRGRSGYAQRACAAAAKF